MGECSGFSGNFSNRAPCFRMKLIFVEDARHTWICAFSTMGFSRHYGFKIGIDQNRQKVDLVNVTNA